MCFSAESSISVGIALVAVGAGTVWLSQRRSELPLALIPLLFGAQQITEGFVWSSLDAGGGSSSSWLVTTYLFFALLLWPSYVPIAAWLVEHDPQRKRIIAACSLLGLGVSGYLGFLLFGRAPSAVAGSHRIVYHLGQSHAGLAIAPYIAAVVVPCLASSYRSLTVLGVLAMVTAAASYAMYAEAFVSVWCFQASVMAAVILAHFLYENGIIPAFSRPSPSQD